MATAAIGAAGSIVGGILQGKGAKKAAKIQQQTAMAQIAANDRARSEITALSQPSLDRGNWAGTTYAGLLGQGDQAASRAALDTYRGSTGYQDLLNTGLSSVNANAYARGTGDSGATALALQRKGIAIADQNQQQYLSNLGNLINTGNSAIANISGATSQNVAANNAALQGSADAMSNAALVRSSALGGAVSNLANIGMGLASSYGTSGAAPLTRASFEANRVTPYALTPRGPF